MAAKISNITELFHRFHQCEMQLRQGKIASCLINFRDILARMPAIPITEKEKTELNAGIELFLRNLSAHKTFQEIFGEVSFTDTDLATNLEFIKSMIAAQEEEIVEKVKKDEEAAEFQRLEIAREEQERLETLRNKVSQAVAHINEGNLPAALEIIAESEEIANDVVAHFNEEGMRHREAKKFDDAVACYQKALEVAADDEHLHYNIARAYYEAEHLDKAEELLAKALQINPDFEEGKSFYTFLLKLRYPSGEESAAEAPPGLLSRILQKLKGLKKNEAPEEPAPAGK